MENNNTRPKVVLGVCAHPDDIEVCAGGSIAKWAKAGAKIYYLVCTDGSKGTSDINISGNELIQTRRREQQAAAEMLGVDDVVYLEYEDGALECTVELKRDIVRAIRRFKPDTVVTMDPTFIYSLERGVINHADHRAAGQATLDAVYPLARDHLCFPELLDEGLQPHKTQNLLLVNFDKANYYEDIGSNFELKLKAINAHSSQFPDAGTIKKRVESMAKQCGKAASCELAEGFIRLELAS